MQVYRLIYGSRAADDALGAAPDVQQIVSTSVRNNSAVGVTGLLLAHDGVFIQVLEGDRAAVTAVYERVARDPRHTDVRIVSADSAPTRLFGAWSMCARSLGVADARLLELVGAAGEDLQPEQLDPVPTLNLLSAVAQMRELDAAA